MTIEYRDATELVSPSPTIVGTGDEVGEDEGTKPRFHGMAFSGPFDDWTQLAFNEQQYIETRPNGHHRSLIEQRNRRARANALMDSACLFLLHKFRREEYIDINELDNVIAGPAGWIKVCLLVRADLVEIVGSDLRITKEGREAIEEIQGILEIQGNGDARR